MKTWKHKLSKGHLLCKLWWICKISQAEIFFFMYFSVLQSNECREQPHENSEMCHLRMWNITAYTVVAHALFVCFVKSSFLSEMFTIWSWCLYLKYNRLASLEADTLFFSFDWSGFFFNCICKAGKSYSIFVWLLFWTAVTRMAHYRNHTDTITHLVPYLHCKCMHTHTQTHTITK